MGLVLLLVTRLVADDTGRFRAHSATSRLVPRENLIPQPILRRAHCPKTSFLIGIRQWGTTALFCLPLVPKETPAKHGLKGRRIAVPTLTPNLVII